MSDKKYPYIGFWDHPNINVIFAEKGLGCNLKRLGRYRGGWTEDEYTNITRDYLANTYGEVKNERHAKFIKSLAEVNGLHDTGVTWRGGDYFHFDKMNRLCFYSKTTASADGETLITMPEPPEDWAPSDELELIKTTSVSVAHSDENGVDTGFNEIGLSDDEWPQVGDEVLIRIDIHEWDVKYGHEVDGMKGVVRSAFKDGDVDVYAVSVDGVCYCFVRGLLTKPKTPEDQLKEELAEKFVAVGYHWSKYVGLLIEEYNITKKEK